MKTKKFNVTVVFGDGTVMRGEDFKKKGRVILPENNAEINSEARRLFHPEEIAEDRRRYRRELAAKRREELIKELIEIQKGSVV